MNKRFNLTMARRTAFCFLIITAFLFLCILRVLQISSDEKYTKTAMAQNGYTLTLSSLRATIYDRNMHPLTNNSYKILAAVSPTPRAVTVLRTVLDDQQMAAVIERLKDNMPIVCELPQAVECDDIICVNVPINANSDNLAPQLLGYTDASNHGVAGLQAAFDDFLYSEYGITVTYTTDGHGNLLNGISADVQTHNEVINSGIQTTLDINIQQIAERAANKLTKGAVVVSEVGTGEIVAMVSRPDYSVTNPALSLNNTDSPFLNRALCAYNVGSVFKPCVAAAALENNIATEFTYTCTGLTDIDGHTFYCHNRSGHEFLDIGGAVAQSCNTFFYNFAQQIGAHTIYNMAKSLGFGSKITLCDNISSSNETIASLATFENSPRLLANLAIGQGNLLISPVAMLNLYQAIAGDGTYTLPSIIKGTVNAGKIEHAQSSAPTRVMSKQTADMLKTYLNLVIESGTGGRAKPDNCAAAGKTATAETGWKNENGKNVEQAWFCGFFPLEAPKYVIIVLAEDSVSGSESSAPIFKEIAESITELEK